jgi:hypothetical protein
VLLGQGYRTAHGVLIDEYGTVGWWSAGKTRRTGRKTVSFEVSRNWTRVFAVRGECTAARALARPESCETLELRFNWYLMSNYRPSCYFGDGKVW